MKQNKHAWILWAIALTVVIALMVVIPFSRSVTWWIGAGCTVLMFAVCAYAFKLACGKEDNIESKLLGWPVFKVGYMALIVQVVVGFILMGIAAFCPIWAAIIAELLVFAVTAASLTVKEAARVAITQSESSLEDRTIAWKAIRSKAAALASSGNAEMKKLAEEIRFADPNPTSLDGEIEDLLGAFKNEPDNKAILQKMTELVKQRSVIAKEEKKN